MIEIRNVTKRFAGGERIEDLNLKLRNGAVYGILDVCGKSGSALLALLSGAILPDAGSVRINGFDTVKDMARARLCVGYLPAGMTPYAEMTPEEYLTFVADAKGLDYEVTARVVQDLLNEVELRGRKRSLCLHLKPVEQRRLCLAQAMVGDPEFVLLDEPTAGLVEREAQEIWSYVWAIGEKKTVFVTGSSLPTLCEVCEEVLIFDGGKLLAAVDAHSEEAETLYRELCDQHGVGADRDRAATVGRRKRRIRRAEGADDGESRG